LRVALLVRAAALLLLAGIAITFPIVGRQPHSYHRGAARDRSGRRRVRLSTGSRVEVDRHLARVRLPSVSVAYIWGMNPSCIIMPAMSG
jgi:hypothetical protein